ncbi:MULTISPECIES: response regulator transcription factor [Paenibacillus]|uniref:response regulator transcription factor n=1 Tax=Paenibacillus TaxID=44249 RepID=UPI000839319F|nr:MULTISPECIES: response regulator transcription factor [Paenibacillus]GIP21717.1 DNA-binding response regulator [Paenibacillus sp. J22TS3]
MRKTILIADDEPEIVDLLRLYLQREQVDIIEANDGREAWERLSQTPVDLVILDIMMPQLDGYQLLKLIRKRYKLPVIILSAKNQDMDKITGLGLGADDFIGKPFNPLEVVARVQAQLRRSYEFNEPSPVPVRPRTKVGRLELDHESCQLYNEGRQMALSALEYKLLALLMEHPGRIFTKRQIFENVWSSPYFEDDNTIMVQISRLRDKMGDDPKAPRYLRTIRGLGYRFSKEEELNGQA